jgi:hypothetical protein
MAGWMDDRLRVLFVGRLDRQKGVDTLLEAMRMIGDHAFALIVGCAVAGPGTGPRAGTVAVGAAGSTPVPAPAGGGLRVMTWNVRTADFDPTDWAPTVAAQRPEVLGLQEICAGEAVELAELLRRDHGLAYEAVPGPVRPTPVEDRDPVNAALRRPCRDGAVVQYGLAVLTRIPVDAAATELFAPDHRDEQRGDHEVGHQREVGGHGTPRLRSIFS